MSDDDLNVGAGVKKSLTKCCCSCFGLSVNPSQKGIMTPAGGETLQKPHGLFGQKSFCEVCMEVAEKDNFGDLTRKEDFGLISCIVKSGDDLK